MSEDVGMSLDELAWFVDHEQPRWNGWTLDAGCRCVRYGHHYYVELDRCLTSAQVLDWIIQLSNKGWVNDSVLSGFVRIVDDVLAPQSKLCSWGHAGELTEDDVTRRIDVVTNMPRSEW